MQIGESRNYHYKPRFSNGSMACSIPPTQYQHVGIPRRRLSYCIRLNVLKLDGSCFGIEVSKMGTVGELKRAVEAVFADLPKEGPDRVSWELVWGQFCLCHDGEMLLTDDDYISVLGMKDGDQLQFIHHASSTNNFVKNKSKGADPDEEDEPHWDKHKNGEKEDNIDCDLEEDDDLSQGDHRLSLLLTGQFPYQKLSSSNSHAERSCSSRNVLDNFKNSLRFSGSKYDSRRLSWRIK